MNLADIIGIIIVLLFIIWGAKKGFMKSVFSLSSFILALILALVLSPFVSGFLKDSAVGNFAYKSAYNMLANEDSTEANAEEFVSSLPLPKVMANNLAHETGDTVGTILEQAAANMADTALSILSLIIVFILVKLILFFLSHVLDLVARLPVLRSANKLLGGVSGAIYGVLIIYVILTILTIGATAESLQKPLEMVAESRVISVMYHQNFLLNFLQ